MQVGDPVSALPGGLDQDGGGLGVGEHADILDQFQGASEVKGDGDQIEIGRFLGGFDARGRGVIHGEDRFPVGRPTHPGDPGPIPAGLQGCDLQQYRGGDDLLLGEVHQPDLIGPGVGDVPRAAPEGVIHAPPAVDAAGVGLHDGFDGGGPAALAELAPAQVVVGLPAGGGLTRLHGGEGDRLPGGGQPVRKMDDVGDFQVHQGFGVVHAHRPERVDGLVVRCPIRCRVRCRSAGEQQPGAITREAEDAPVQIAGGDQGDAVGGVAFHHPGVAVREVNQPPRQIQRGEDGLHAHQHDLGHRLLDGDHLDGRFGDLHAVFVQAAVGDLLQTVLAQLQGLLFAFGQELAGLVLLLEGDHYLLDFELLPHADDGDFRLIGEHGVGGRFDAVQFAERDPGGVQCFLDGAARRQAQGLLRAVGAQAHFDAGFRGRRGVTCRQQCGQQGEPEQGMV